MDTGGAMEYEVTEHRPGTHSYQKLKRELREYNRTHPKEPEPMPSGWWIAPGLVVAILVVVALVAL